MAKHKIKIQADEESVERFQKWMGSIRSRVLQKLVLMWFNLWIMGRHSELHKKIERRLRKKNLPYTKDNFAYELREKEVMGVLHCSERTAREYVKSLRLLRI